MFRRFFASRFNTIVHLAELVCFMPVEGPDFICIGMPKAGTSWLYEQLSGHPDFWMPRVKELQYLNHRRPPLRHVDRHLRQIDRPAAQRERPAKRASDAAQRAFLAEIKALAGQDMNIERYVALFRHKSTRISGDISPPYVSLREDVIAEIARRLPEVKILLLVREPIERLWSGISMNHRKGKFDASVLEHPKRFEEYFLEARLDDHLFPTRVLNRWRRMAPNVQFRSFLFDDIVAHAAGVRHDVLAFLGADEEKGGGPLPPDYNRKANAPKLPLSEGIKEVLLGHFADEIRTCAELFGGSAQQWVQRYEL